MLAKISTPGEPKVFHRPPPRKRAGIYCAAMAAPLGRRNPQGSCDRAETRLSRGHGPGLQKGAPWLCELDAMRDVGDLGLPEGRPAAVSWAGLAGSLRRSHWRVGTAKSPAPSEGVGVAGNTGSTFTHGRFPGEGVNAHRPSPLAMAALSGQSVCRGLVQGSRRQMRLEGRVGTS